MKGGYTGCGLWYSGVFSLGRDGIRKASRDGASSDGMGRRNGSDEGGNGKTDADVEVMVGSGQRCG